MTTNPAGVPNAGRPLEERVTDSKSADGSDGPPAFTPAASALTESTSGSTQYVCIGRVGRAHGLAGAFFVSDRDAPVPRNYARLFIGDDMQTAVPTDILASAMQSGRPMLRCSLSLQREAAEALTGKKIFVERSKIGPIRGRDLIWADLEGAAVCDTANHALGVVAGLYNAGASDVMIVRGADGRSVDVPLVPAYFDPDQVAADGLVRLKVEASFFDDLWQPARPSK